MKIRSAIFSAVALFLSLGGDNSQAQEPPRLANISTRMQVLTGDDVLIAGFIIGGSAPKTVVVRARGPSLAPLGVPGVLANPQLQLFTGQTPIASNDDWGQASNAGQISSSGFAPAEASESAVLTTLSPGAYTAIVTGVGGTTGVAIVEVFEVDGVDVPLINISTRGRVLTGADVMIGGFIIQGTGQQAVVVRARGPSLAADGVPNALPDPNLVVFSGQTPIASNDNYTTTANFAQLNATGFAPSNWLESAVLVTLSPGAYTAIVSGVGNTTGVGIVEVFTVPDMPPVVLSSSPAHTAELMPVHTPVSVTFSEPMDPATITASTFTLTGPAGAVPATVSLSGSTATLTPVGPLLTAASYTGAVTTGARDLAGQALAASHSFTFTTAVGEPPPVVDGCPTPEAGAEIRRFEWGETPIVRRASGAITSYRLKRSQIGRESISFVQTQVASTPGTPMTEITISRCPGVIEPSLHFACRVATWDTLYNGIAAYDRLPAGYANQDELGARGCLASGNDQYYVNVRWTYASCPFSMGCGFALQWVEGGQ